MADEDELAPAPRSSFPWLRQKIEGAKSFLARNTPPPETSRDVSRSTGKTYDVEYLPKLPQVSLMGMGVGAADRTLNWLDFARSGDRRFIGPAEVLAPAGLGVAQLLNAPRGAVGVFGGDVGARALAKAGRPTAQEAMHIAKGMEAKGFAPLEIDAATRDFISRHDPSLGGVTKGVDQKWRFEISDAGAKLTGRASGRLDQVLDHPELFTAYPQLRAMPVRQVPGQGAVFNQNLFAGRPVGVGSIEYGATSPDKLTTILHEVQHALQLKEGFAFGTSPEAMATEFGVKLTPQQAVEAYALAGGEVEARNVEKRQPLTAGERRAMHPAITEDRPRSKQFVLFGDRQLLSARQLAKGPPSVELKPLRYMMAPNKTIATWAYDMVDGQGRSIGKINGAYYPGSKELRVHMVQLKNPATGEWVPEGVSANMLSKTQVRDVFRELKRHFPERETVSGIRQTGVRGARGEETSGTSPDKRTGADDITRVPMSGSLKAATGVPGMQVPPSRSIPDEQNFRFEEEEREKVRDWWEKEREADPDSQFNDYQAERSWHGGEDQFMQHFDSLEGRYPWRGGYDSETQRHMHNYMEMRRRRFHDRGLGPMSDAGGRELTLVADVHIGRSSMRRVTLESIDDSGPLQMATVKGFDGETYQAPVGGMFGFASRPTVGSVGYVFAGGGRADRPFLFGLEDPGLRPRDQADGETVMYSKGGQSIVMGEDGNLVITGPGQVRPDP